MKLQLNFTETQINEDLCNELNVNGIMKYSSTSLIQFYFNREFLEALIYGFENQLFKFISLLEFVNRKKNNLLEEGKNILIIIFTIFNHLIYQLQSLIVGLLECETYFYVFYLSMNVTLLKILEIVWLIIVILLVFI